MKNAFSHIACIAAGLMAVSAFTSTAFAGTPVSVVLGTTVGSQVPIAGGGLLGLAAVGVVAGVWIARRRKR